MLSASERDAIRYAIDARVRELRPPPVYASRRSEGRSLAEITFDAAAGDPLLALSFAADAIDLRSARSRDDVAG